MTSADSTGSSSRRSGSAATASASDVAERAPRLRDLEWKPVFILLSSLVFLTLLWSYGRLPFFYEHISPGIPPDHDHELYAHLWLSGFSVLTRMVLPLLCIVLVLKGRPRDYGYRLGGTGGLGRIYLALLAVMLPVLYLASTTEAFSRRYPLYDGVAASATHFIVYEASYLLVFLSGESFWRGYLIFGLQPYFGYYAIAVMATPYVMIHWGKPFPETFGALLTACVLGWLALRHRSFWLGVALHFSVALTMDVLALLQKGSG